MKTPYDVLRISPNADEKTIAIAFRKAAKQCHPDVNPGDQHAAQRFKQISAARDALEHPAWRALYQYLHFRRHHDRRQWIITVVSCIISAVVSGGMVSFLQKPPLPDTSITAATLSVELDSASGRFEFSGPGTDRTGRENDGRLQGVASQKKPSMVQGKPNDTAISGQNGDRVEVSASDRQPQQVSDVLEDNVQQTEAANSQQLLDILEDDLQLTDSALKASKEQHFDNCHESRRHRLGASRCFTAWGRSAPRVATRHSTGRNHKGRKSHIILGKDASRTQ
jgi:curved DNA-binding protein CbpA